MATSNPTGTNINSSTSQSHKSEGEEITRPIVREAHQTGTNTIKRHMSSGKKPSAPDTPHARHPDMD